MPKSGKTTVVDIVSHTLKRRGYLVADYHGGGRYAPVGKDDLAALNLVLTSNAVNYLAVVGNDARPPRIHLMDRGVLDRVVFTTALRQLRRISDGHASAVTGLCLLPELVDKLSAAFVFTTSPTLSIERELENKLEVADGRVMNTTMLTALADAARNLPAVNGVVRTRFVDTETENGDPRGTARRVVDDISVLL